MCQVKWLKTVLQSSVWVVCLEKQILVRVLSTTLLIFTGTLLWFRQAAEIFISVIKATNPSAACICKAVIPVSHLQQLPPFLFHSAERSQLPDIQSAPGSPRRFLVYLVYKDKAF